MISLMALLSMVLRALLQCKVVFCNLSNKYNLQEPTKTRHQKKKVRVIEFVFLQMICRDEDTRTLFYCCQSRHQNVGSKTETEWLLLVVMVMVVVMVVMVVMVVRVLLRSRVLPKTNAVVVKDGTLSPKCN